ncbi:MAG: hypothetical protein ABI222_17555 [Opitutaceae bacterium]
MKPPGPTANSELLFRRLAENNDESATAALFLQLYRQSPELRQWLREEYARDGKLRMKFDGLAMNGVPPQVARFAELTEDNRSWREERRRLKMQMPRGLYGGLTWNGVAQLVHRYQAGTLDPGTFLLVRQWREAGKTTPALIWAGLALLESVLPSGKRRLLKHLNHALSFVKKFENKAERRTAVGYTDWWKLNVLFYVLRHPRESYSTRDLRAHLATLGLDIGTRDMRRFCKRHGLKRDMRAGRPRTRTSLASSARTARSTGKRRVTKRAKQ